MVWRIPEICVLLMSKIPDAYAFYLISASKNDSRIELIRKNRRGLCLMLVVATILAVFYAVFGSYIVSLWIGDAAPKNETAYVVCALAMFFVIAARWPTMSAYWLKKTRPLVVIAASELVIKLIVMVIFLNYQLFYSPAAAIVIVHVLFAFYLYMRLGCRIASLDIDNKK